MNKGIPLAALLGSSLALSSSAFAFLPDDSLPATGAREYVGLPPPGERLVRSDSKVDAREAGARIAGAAIDTLERDALGGDLRFVSGDLGVSLEQAFGGEAALAKWVTSARREQGRKAFGAEIDKRLSRWVARNAAALGFEARDLRFNAAKFFADSDHVFVSYDVILGGVQVKGASVDFRFAGGTLVQIAARTFGAAASASARAAAGDAALQAVADEALARRVLGPSAKVVGASRPLLFPSVKSDGTGYAFDAARSLQAVSATGEPFSIIASSRSGEVLEWHSLHFKVSGRIEGVVNNRSQNDGQSTLGMPYAQGSTGGWLGRKTFTADKEGKLDAPGVEELKVGLTSPYVKVRNSGGRTAAETARGDVTFDAKNNSTLAETTTFYHLNVVREWAKTHITNAWFDKSIDANVNIGEVCNAYFDGSSVNFFIAGSRTKNGKTIECNNTGEIADVVYHEWGHGIDANTGGIDDGAYSEGIGDIVSMLITGSNEVGPGFFKDGKPVRDLKGDYTYPPAADAREPHKEGLIIGSTWFDLTKALEEKYGKDVGRETATKWFLKSLYTTSHYTDVYKSLLALDADGRSRGSSNTCLINTVFTRRGLAKEDASCVR